MNSQEFSNILVKIKLQDFCDRNNISNIGFKSILNKNNKATLFTNYYFEKIINNNNKVIIYFDYKYKIINLSKYKNDIILDNSIKPNNLFDFLNDMFKIKIQNYEQSGDLFKYKKIKKEMFESNKSFKIVDIVENHVCKADGISRDIVTLYNHEQDVNLKFLLSDIKIEYPDVDKVLNIKGYHLPKERILKNGLKFKVVNNKYIRNIPVGEIGVIKKLTTIKAKANSNYIETTIGSNPKSVMLIKKNIKIID